MKKNDFTFHLDPATGEFTIKGRFKDPVLASSKRNFLFFSTSGFVKVSEHGCEPHPHDYKISCAIIASKENVIKEDQDS